MNGIRVKVSGQLPMNGIPFLAHLSAAHLPSED
ncbi:hypothetical protein CEXT_339701, partial [Caerostris extrusa]